MNAYWIKLPNTRLCRVAYHTGRDKARVNYSAILQTPISCAQLQAILLSRKVGLSQVDRVYPVR